MTKGKGNPASALQLLAPFGLRPYVAVGREVHWILSDGSELFFPLAIVSMRVGVGTGFGVLLVRGGREGG